MGGGVDEISNDTVDSGRWPLRPTLLFVILVVGLWSASAASIRAQSSAETRAALKRVLSSDRYDTGGDFREGDQSFRPQGFDNDRVEGRPRPSSDPDRWRRRRSRRPGLPGLDIDPDVLRFIAILLLLALITWIVLEIVRARRGRAAPGRSVAKPELPAAPRPTALPGMAAVDAAVARGDWSAAVHELLLVILGTLSEASDHRLRPSETSRAILRKLRLGADRMNALGEVVGVVERSHFGGIVVEEESYRHCRALCAPLLQDLGVAR